MINKYVAIGLGALIALAPVAAVAQTPAATPDTSMASPAKHTGTHSSHMRRKGNTAADRARASAHHMHHMRTAPAAAPKS
jgi:hypothetical protein